MYSAKSLPKRNSEVSLPVKTDSGDESEESSTTEYSPLTALRPRQMCALAFLKLTLEQKVYL